MKNNIWLSSLVVFFLFFAIYGSVYFFVDGIYALDDHLFHFKYAYLLRMDGLEAVNDFKWLPIGDSRYDISLFQIALIPFTFFKDLFTGIRVSDTFLAASSLSVVYFFLRKFKYKYSFLAVLILFSSSFFSARLFLGRGYILTFGLMLAELYFIKEKKYGKFFGASLFHILWHRSSFFFPLMIVFVVETARYLAEKKVSFKNFTVASLAIISGMAFFPDFPKNIFKWFFAIIELTYSTNKGAKLEGTELYVKNIFDLIGANQLFSFVAVISISLVVYIYVKNKKENGTIEGGRKENLVEIYSFFLMLIVFILGSIKISGRFFDYYFILVIVLWASILKLIFAEKEIIINEKIAKYFIAACFIFFSYLGVNNYLDLRIRVASSDYQTIKAPIEWIRDNSDEKESIYLHNWSDFPQAFFYNDKNAYSWGIEPKALDSVNPKLYWKAYNILAYSFYCEKQEDCEEDVKLNEERIKKLSPENQEAFRKENSRKIISSVRDDFGSRFILSSNSNFSELIKLNEDLIEDKFESVSEKNKNHKVTAFKLK